MPWTQFSDLKRGTSGTCHLMPIYQVVILAIVQGFTEFLPVSSTAHLALIPWLFGWKDPGLSPG